MAARSEDIIQVVCRKLQREGLPGRQEDDENGDQRSIDRQRNSVQEWNVCGGGWILAPCSLLLLTIVFITSTVVVWYFG